MFRGWIFLSSILLVLGMVGNAPADDFQWDNSAGDFLWRTTDNWDVNKLPGEGDALYVDWIRDPTEIIIDADTDAKCNSITLSNDASGGQGFVHLHVTGGTFVAGNPGVGVVAGKIANFQRLCVHHVGQNCR